MQVGVSLKPKLIMTTLITLSLTSYIMGGKASQIRTHAEKNQSTSNVWGFMISHEIFNITVQLTSTWDNRHFPLIMKRDLLCELLSFWSSISLISLDFIARLFENLLKRYGDLYQEAGEWLVTVFNCHGWAEQYRFYIIPPTRIIIIKVHPAPKSWFHNVPNTNNSIFWFKLQGIKVMFGNRNYRYYNVGTP